MPMVCPYCLRALDSGFSAKGVIRSCNVCGNIFEGSFIASQMLKLGRVPKCVQSGCLGQYSRLSCSSCRTELPNDILQYDKYLRFAVVAPSGAGKTVFMTTMIDEFKKARSLNYFVSHMNRETLDYYTRNYRMLYEDLDTTGMGTAPGSSHPMQWKLQDMSKQTKSKIPTYSLTMFDGAGEDQAALDPKISRYIAGSKLIMLLLDPTKLAGVMREMTDEEYNCAGGEHERVTSEYTQNFILELINYLKTACNVNVRQKLKIPVAVVFGKIDAVQRHLGSAMVLQSSGHAAQGGFIENESQQIHSEISGWMENCGDNLNRLFDANVEKWRYFGVSSFGSLPTSRTKIQRPMPLRVLDPLIWDLSLEGIVKTI